MSNLIECHSNFGVIIDTLIWTYLFGYPKKTILYSLYIYLLSSTNTYIVDKSFQNNRFLAHRPDLVGIQSDYDDHIHLDDIVMSDNWILPNGKQNDPNYWIKQNSSVSQSVSQSVPH